jgi:hypothetical protein
MLAACGMNPLETRQSVIDLCSKCHKTELQYREKVMMLEGLQNGA